MKKIESYTTNVIIFDYESLEERDEHIKTMKSLGYFSTVALAVPSRVSYTKMFVENHKEL